MDGESRLKSDSVRSLIIDKELIRKYSVINDKRALLDITIRTLFHALLMAAGYRALIGQEYLVAMLFLIPHFIAYSFLGWAGIGHEMFHNTVFSNKKINLFLFRLFSILTWNNYKYFEVTHWKHHKDTLLPDDPEGNPEQGIKKSAFFWLILIDLPAFLRRIKVLTMNSFNKVPGILGTTLFAPGTKARKELCSAARVILLFHITLITLFVYLNLYWSILIINLAPFILTIFNQLLAVSQHYGTTPEENTNYFLSTRTVVLDRVFSFLYANMNYHVEHHFFPFVPYYNLPKLHQFIAETNSYAHYSRGFIQLFRDLRNLGCFKS